MRKKKLQNQNIETLIEELKNMKISTIEKTCETATRKIRNGGTTFSHSNDFKTSNQVTLGN